MAGPQSKSRAFSLLLILLCVTNSIYSAPTAPSNNDTSSSSSSEETVEVGVDTTTPDQRQSEVEDVEENTALETSLESFLGLIPVEKIRNMSAVAYLSSDATRESFNFLRSREFLDAKDKLLQASEVQEFVKFLNQSGLNVVRFVRKVSNLTGIPATIINPEEAEDLSESAEEEGTNAASVLTQLLDKILAELPQEQFFTIFFEKMESDSEFSEFVERLNGDEFEAILVKVQVKQLFMAMWICELTSEIHLMSVCTGIEGTDRIPEEDAGPQHGFREDLDFDEDFFRLGEQFLTTLVRYISFALGFR